MLEPVLEPELEPMLESEPNQLLWEIAEPEPEWKQMSNYDNSQQRWTRAGVGVGVGAGHVIMMIATMLGEIAVSYDYAMVIPLPGCV